MTIQEFLKSQDYIKDFHLSSLKNDKGYILRVWIYEDKYVAQVLTGKKLEQLIKEKYNIPIRYDIYYV